MIKDPEARDGCGTLPVYVDPDGSEERKGYGVNVCQGLGSGYSRESDPYKHEQRHHKYQLKKSCTPNLKSKEISHLEASIATCFRELGLVQDSPSLVRLLTPISFLLSSLLEISFEFLKSEVLH